MEKDNAFRSLLFARGYLLTSNPNNVAEEIGVLSDWKKRKLRSFTLFTHPESDFHVYEVEKRTWLLIGHAFDPWEKIAGEKQILEGLSQAYADSEEQFYHALDRLTGRFALYCIKNDGGGFVVQDAVGLKNVYFLNNQDEIWFASHSQLLADIHRLQQDPDIHRMVNSFFYGIGIRHLPGIHSPFREISMVSANTLLHFPSFQRKRFFPRNENLQSNDLDGLAQQIGEPMRRSFDLLVQKKKLALSLSIGTDSRVTFSASKEHQSNIHYFSYISDTEEKRDATKAAKMCQELGMKHHLYSVPVEEIKQKDDLNDFIDLLNQNSAHIRNPTITEICKLYYLYNNFPKGLMEVKTPISEIGRAIYCKKTGRKKMPDKLKPRNMSNLYKRNMFDRKSLKFMDSAFNQFIKATNFGENFYNYEEHDLFYWEHRNTAWASLANQDHDIIHDMTSIFNNREILKLFLATSRKHRISDDLHREVIRYLWPDALKIPLGKSPTIKDKVRKVGERVFFAVNRF